MNLPPGFRVERRTRQAPRRFDPDPGPRGRRPWWLVAVVVAVVVAFLFLRGPNGLLRIIGRARAVRAADTRLTALRGEADSMETLRVRLSDTAWARVYATGLLGADSAPADSLP